MEFIKLGVEIAIFFFNLKVVRIIPQNINVYLGNKYYSKNIDAKFKKRFKNTFKFF